MKITAIIIALNEAEFIEQCLKPIYQYCDSIKIQTGYDRSFSSLNVQPDETINKILSFPDPDGKISLHIHRIPDEAIARNWLMRTDGYNLNHYHKSTTSAKNIIDNFCQPADYFWIIDADEIYDPQTIPDIIDYLKSRKPNFLRIRGITYFKSWNYRVSPSDNFYQPGFIKRGILFESNRYIFPPLIYRLIRNKYYNLGKTGDQIIQIAEKLRGYEDLPENIAVFHHGSYVGDDERIFKKISLSGHKSEISKYWYENVWKSFTPNSIDLHPVNPPIFAGVQYIPTSKLPTSISQEIWSQDYMEDHQNFDC